MLSKPTGAVGACLLASVVALIGLPTAAGAEPAAAPAQTCVAITTVVTGQPTCANATVTFGPCVTSPTLPGCVNTVFDVAVGALETGRNTYNRQVQPIADQGACRVYTILTGDPCPGLVPTL